MAYIFTRASSQYLESSSSPVSSYPATMSCWFNTTNTTTNQYMMSVCKNGAIDSMRLAYYGSTDDKVYMECYDSAGGNYGAVSTSAYSSGWAHACGVVTSATSRQAWLNGSSAGVNTSSVVVSGCDRLLAGARRNNVGVSIYWDGMLAELGWWNVALSASEIASLSSGVSPLFIRPGSLVTYLPLIGNKVEMMRGLTFSDSVSAPAAANTHPRVFLR